MNQVMSQVVEKLQGLDTRRQYYVLGGVLLVFLVADFYLIMIPQVNALKKLNADIITMSLDLQRVKTDSKRAGEFNKQLDRLRDDVKNMSSKIRSKQEVPLILEDISRLANQYDVKIDELMPIKDAQEIMITNNDGSYLSIPILIRARCGYHQLAKFLNQLETVGLFASTQQFRISANDKDTTHHNVEMTIKTVVLDKTLTPDKIKPKKK